MNRDRDMRAPWPAALALEDQDVTEREVRGDAAPQPAVGPVNRYSHSPWHSGV